MAGKNRIVIKESKNHQKYTVVKGPNNQVLAVTETYKRIDGVKNAAAALKKVMKNAVIINQTKK